MSSAGIALEGNLTVHVAPVRPAQIADLASIQTAPPLLAGLIALTMVIGLVAGLGRAIRIRRRELAVLRALGCRSSQIYATLCWQALTVVVIGLVVGVPLGTIGGFGVVEELRLGPRRAACGDPPIDGDRHRHRCRNRCLHPCGLAAGSSRAADRPAAALRES